MLFALVLMMVASVFVLVLPPHILIAASLSIAVATILVVNPRAYLHLYLATGGLSLAIFATGRRELLKSFGGMEPDGLRLLAFSVGALLLVLLRPNLLLVIGRYRLAVAFVLVLATSLLYSSSIVEGVRLFLKICFPLMTYVLIITEVRTKDDIRSMLRACLMGVGCVGVVTIVRLVSGDSLYVIDAGGLARFQGPMGAGTLAFYCTCLSLLCYSYGTMQGKRHWVSIAAAIVFGAIVAATGTRVAAAGLLAAVVTIDCVRGRFKRGCVVGTIGLLVVAVLTPVLKRFAYSRDVHELAGLSFGGGFWENLSVVDTSGRDMLWRRVWEDLVLTSPVFGHGIGSSNHYLTDMLGTVEGAVPHDEILRLLADTGVIGASLGVALAVSIVRRLWRTQLPEADRYEFLRPLALASFVSFLVCSLTDNTLEFYSVLTGYIAAFSGLLKVRSDQLGAAKLSPVATLQPSHAGEPLRSSPAPSPQS